MDVKAKQNLKNILLDCDNNTVVIFGSSLYYELKGETMIDDNYNWGFFFEEIINDSDFITETDNMQLIITLKTTR